MVRLAFEIVTLDFLIKRLMMLVIFLFSFTRLKKKKEKANYLSYIQTWHRRWKFHQDLIVSRRGHTRNISKAFLRWFPKLPECTLEVDPCREVVPNFWTCFPPFEGIPIDQTLPWIGRNQHIIYGGQKNAQLDLAWVLALHATNKPFLLLSRILLWVSSGTPRPHSVRVKIN